MSTFKSIPYSDIVKFLHNNKLDASSMSEENAYIKAWQLVSTNKINEAPTSIVDFIIAYNLAQSKQVYNVVPSNITKEYIYTASDEKMKLLANSLYLPSVDRSRIIRILNHLGLISTTQIDDLTSSITKLKLKDHCYTGGISSSKYHSLVIVGGMVYSIGDDNFGKLGNATTYVERLVWNKVQNNGKAKQVATNASSSFILCEDGTIYFCGQDCMNLIDSQVKNYFIPVLIPNVQSISFISVSDCRVLFLHSDGNVYINTSNKLEIITELNNVKTMIAGNMVSLFLDHNGYVYMMIKDEVKLIKELQNIKYINYNKRNRACAIDTNNKLYIFNPFKINEDNSQFTQYANSPEWVYPMKYHFIVVDEKGLIYIIEHPETGEINLTDKTPIMNDEQHIYATHISIYNDREELSMFVVDKQNNIFGINNQGNVGMFNVNNVH